MLMASKQASLFLSMTFFGHSIMVELAELKDMMFLTHGQLYPVIYPLINLTMIGCSTIFTV